MRAPLIVASVLLLASSACDRHCPASSCEDALALTVALPAEPRSYTFSFVTDAGDGVCVLEVPLWLGSSDCDNPNVVRWGPKDESSETVAEFYLLNATTAQVSVNVESDNVHSETVEPDPGSAMDQEGSENSCSGPCQITTAEMDLSGLSLP